MVILGARDFFRPCRETEQLRLALASLNLLYGVRDVGPGCPNALRSGKSGLWLMQCGASAGCCVEVVVPDVLRMRLGLRGPWQR